MIKLKIERTKTGLPALWEEGGGRTKTGFALVIAAKDGAPKTALYVKRRGHLACGQHALVAIEPGDWVIRVRSDGWEPFDIEVLRISAIEGDDVLLDLAHEFAMGDWHTPPPSFLDAAIEAAIEKATCYHCREPHYASTQAGTRFHEPAAALTDDTW